MSEITLHFIIKSTPDKRIIDLPVLSDHTMMELLPTLSKISSIQNISITNLEDQVFTAVEYKLPVKDLIDKFGKTFYIIGIVGVRPMKESKPFPSDFIDMNEVYKLKDKPFHSDNSEMEEFIDKLIVKFEDFEEDRKGKKTGDEITVENVKIMEMPIRTLKGHEKGVLSVAVSPDGKYIISGSLDYTIKVWELATGTLVRTLKGHFDQVFSVAVSPDGNYIISGSGDGTIKVWEFNTGTLIHTLGTGFYVNSVTVSPDAKYIVSGYFGQVIKVWELETGKLIQTLEGHEKSVLSVAVSPDGKFIVSGSEDKTIKVWEFKKGKMIRSLKGHDEKVNSVAFSPDGKEIISGSEDNIIKVWNLKKGTLLRSFGEYHKISKDKKIDVSDLLGKDKKLEKSITSIAISSNGKNIISGSKDFTIKVWELETANITRTFKGHESHVNSVAVTPEGNYIISGSADKTIKIWKTSFKIKKDLEKSLLKIESLIQEEDFSNAENELNNILNIAISLKFDNLIKEIQEKLNVSKEKQDRLIKEAREKIKRELQVSTQINLDKMQEALKLDKKTFNSKIFEWASEFDFTIDGNYLIINKDTVSDFIDELDKQFAIWEKKEQEKIEKI